jgi:hypothetical protein
VAQTILSSVYRQTTQAQPGGAQRKSCRYVSAEGAIPKGVLVAILALHATRPNGQLNLTRVEKTVCLAQHFPLAGRILCVIRQKKNSNPP